MNTVLNLFGNLGNGLGCIGELLGYFLRFLSMFFHTRAASVPNCLTGQAVADALQIMVDGGPSVSSFLVRKLDESFGNVATTGSADVDFNLDD